MPVDRDLFDYLELTLQIAGLLVTGGGLAFVVVSLNQTAKQHRIEAGPYIRIDIAAADDDLSSFKGPQPYFRRSDLFIDLSGGASDGVMGSAWFRNYQEHSLGMAIGVSAVFLVDTGAVESVLNDVFIAYVERDKPVIVDIATLSRSLPQFNCFRSRMSTSTTGDIAMCTANPEPMPCMVV